MLYSKYELKQILENGIATVVFTKVDGTEREMKCTLQSAFLPVREEKQEQQLLVEEKVKVENPNVLAVWDLENNAWRSFKLDSIKEIR